MNRELLDVKDRLLKLRKQLADMEEAVFEQEEDIVFCYSQSKLMETTLEKLKADKKSSPEEVKNVETSIATNEKKIKALTEKLAKDKTSLQNLEEQYMKLVSEQARLELEEERAKAREKASWKREARLKAEALKSSVSTSGASPTTGAFAGTSMGTATNRSTEKTGGIGSVPVTSSFQNAMNRLNAFGKYEAAADARFNAAMLVGATLDKLAVIEELTKKYVGDEPATGSGRDGVTTKGNASKSSNLRENSGSSTKGSAKGSARGNVVTKGLIADEAGGVNDELAELKKLLIDQGLVTDEEDAPAKTDKKASKKTTTKKTTTNKSTNTTKKKTTKSSTAKKTTTAKNTTANKTSGTKTATKSSAAKTGAAKTGAAKSTTTKSSTAKTGAAKSTTTRSSTAKTGAAKSTTTKSSTAKKSSTTSTRKKTDTTK